MSYWRECFLEEVGQEGRAFCPSNNWVASQSTKRNIRPEKQNSVPGRDNTILGDSGKTAKTGMFPGELRIESSCWSIHLCLINIQHWLDCITFFPHWCQVIIIGAGFSPPICACPRTSPKMRLSRRDVLQGSSRRMRKIARTLDDAVWSGHYSAQGEKALTERDKMVVTSKDLSFSNGVERSHISPGSTVNFFSCSVASQKVMN